MHICCTILELLCFFMEFSLPSQLLPDRVNSHYLTDTNKVTEMAEILAAMSYCTSDNHPKPWRCSQCHKCFFTQRGVGDHFKALHHAQAVAFHNVALHCAQIVSCTPSSTSNARKRDHNGNHINGAVPPQDQQGTSSLASPISPIECCICLEQYDKINRPHTLPCAHNFCGRCLQSCIAQGLKTCSVCRRPYTANTVNDIPVNPDLETIVQMWPMIAANTTKTNEFSNEEEDFNMGRCPKHKMCYLYHKCKTHNIHICHECTIIDHPTSKCTIVEIKQEYLKAKENALKEAQENICDVDSAKAILINIMEEKNKVISKTEAQLQFLLNEIDKECKVRDQAKIDIVENENRVRKLHESIDKLQQAITQNQINKEYIEHREIVKSSRKRLEELNMKYERKDFNKHQLKENFMGRAPATLHKVNVEVDNLPPAPVGLASASLPSSNVEVGNLQQAPTATVLLTPEAGPSKVVISDSDSPELVLRQAVREESIGTGQGIVRCRCQKGCQHSRCKCLKNQRVCNSRCHHNLPCKNKFI